MEGHALSSLTLAGATVAPGGATGAATSTASSTGAKGVASATKAKKLRWHSDERISDGKYLWHPTDSLQWKKINEMFPQFGSEPRNL